MRKKSFEQIADTKTDKIVRAGFYLLMVFVLMLIILPLMHILACSFSSANEILSGKVTLFPRSFSLKSYIAVVTYKDFLRGLLNSFFYSAFGPLVSVTMTVCLAYPLSKNDLPGHQLILKLLLFTMIFSGGLIPTYLVSRSVGLTNSRIGFLFLTSALSAYNVFIARTYFKNSIDQNIYDAAEIDGASTLRCLWSIVLPLSKAVIAVLMLWEVVAYWNNYQGALVYLTDRELQPLQMVVREIMNMTNVDPNMATESADMEELRNLQVTLKYAIIVVSSLPLLMIFPFVQKHFEKGVMLGSVKG